MKIFARSRLFCTIAKTSIPDSNFEKHLAKLMPLRPLFPCVLGFADITWSKGTHNITLKKWPHFQNGLNKRGSSRTLNKITSKSGLKSLNIEKETFSTKNDVILTYKSQNVYLSGSNLPL